MTPKERFLQSITDKINRYQAAYESARNLPDEIFESLNMTSDFDSKEHINGKNQNLNETLPKGEITSPHSYGSNRKLVVHIFNTIKKAIRREDIMRELGKLNPNIDADAVTRNTLSALNTRGVIKKYKPEGIIFRGAYWTLSTWWKDGELMPEYEPEPYDAVSKYLG